MHVRDVQAAAEQNRTLVVRTPVVRTPTLDSIAGTELWLKAENLQRSGAYKMRGACYALGRLSAAQRELGVIAQSTGNHGLAIALAARELGISATVVLPTDAPATKVARARECGANVLLAGTTVEERRAVVARVQELTGGVVIDAYDHPDVIAGQGTATMELLDEVVAQTGEELDALLVPVGGGGGVAGACLVAAPRGVAVYGVEPRGCDSLHQSLLAGRVVTVPPGRSIADGLKPSTVGALPFAIAREHLAGTLLVDDDGIGRALVLLALEAGLVVEPSGAAAAAAALFGALPANYRRVGVLLTGGNVDARTLSELMARAVADRQPKDAA